MIQAFKYNFDVHGRSAFPMLMLSMEGCFPTTVVDGDRIRESFFPAPLPVGQTQREPVKVNLTIITTDHYWQPKIEHWNSQGWTVGAIRTEPNWRTY